MKALTLTLAILALLGSAASGFFYVQIGNTKTQLKNQLSAEQTRAASLGADLEKTSGERDGLQTRLTATDGELGDTKSKLTAAEARTVQSARESAQLKVMLTKAEAEQNRLNTDFDTLRRELVQARLAAQVGGADEIEKYKVTVATLEAQIASLGGGKAPSAAPADGSAPAVQNVTAKVASVGNKNAFVILELSAAGGTANGSKLLISRDGKVIAEAVISEVKDTFAVAQVIPSSIKSTIIIGDATSFIR